MIEANFAQGAGPAGTMSQVGAAKANRPTWSPRQLATNKRAHTSPKSLFTPAPSRQARQRRSIEGARRKRAASSAASRSLCGRLDCRKRAIYALILALLPAITWTASSQLVGAVGPQESGAAPGGANAPNSLEGGQSIPMENQRRGPHQHAHAHPGPPPPRQAAQAAATLRVTEADLIPISDFNVPQPAFNDLMRNWPPTTLRALDEAQRHRPGRPHHRQQNHHSSLHHHQQHRHRHHHNHQQQLPLAAPRRPELGADEEEDGSGGGGGEMGERAANELRNYLDEDMDDGLVTADQKFEPDHVSEPLGWVNYLRELGDYIYAQLRSPETANDQARLDHIEELLDDQYYEQYENSQVLYYGPQLAREGDMVEIGCYMPINQPAAWTKSGRPVPDGGRLVRRNEFLHAKLNFSLKIFEATPADSGNYRCNGMSRKYHKLVVVSQKTSVAQLYLIQQRLLTVINPVELSHGSRLPPLALALATSRAPKPAHKNNLASRRQLLPSYLITEGEPLVISCNISDETVARRLRENPSFLLEWYKNGKLLNIPQPRVKDRHLSPKLAQYNNPHHTNHLEVPKIIPGGQRLQLVQANGRQLFISAARYSDAGDYLCSWYRLPSSNSRELSNDGPNDGDDQTEPQATVPASPLAAGSLVQLLAPVKLRPFRSTYHVRAGNQLRLVCQVQRGYPSANISWYIGNRLADAEFLRNHSDEFQVLQLHDQNRFSASPTNRISSSSSSSSSSGGDQSAGSAFKIVEINPIPAGRHQQQASLGSTDHGRWVDYRDPSNEKWAIDTGDQQLKYLQQKLHQLTGYSHWQQGSGGDQSSSANQLLSQATVSVLVVNSLKMEEHSSRYACRASTRSNTDEVTTVIRVQESSVSVVRPTAAKATLNVGEPLYFECRDAENPQAQFFWFKKDDPTNGGQDRILVPDDQIEIHNERLVLMKPGYDAVGDYKCTVTDDRKRLLVNESAVIKVRQEIYIADFGRPTSHTGQSSIINKGERLELTCSGYPYDYPLDITWLKSTRPDDDRHMSPIPENQAPPSELPESLSPGGVPTYLAAEHSIMIERLGNNTKKLIISAVDYEHRGYYACRVDNLVTEPATKKMFIRVKDNLVALWPALGIVAELVILATIIYIWETQRAYKELRAATGTRGEASSSSAASGQQTSAKLVNKREAAGASRPFENVPLTTG